MPISSRTLFHFVNTLEYLKKILNNDFHPRYCLEKIKTDMTDCVEWYIPMKCFCDIPLSQISEHTKKYGKYGIGLTKNWAMRNGVSPIIYLYENSNTYREINVVHGKILSDAYKKYVKKNSKRTRREIIESLSVLAYIKPIEGDMMRDEVKIHVNFYDEREWRYIPQVWDKIAINTNGLLMIPKSLAKDEVKLMEKSQSILRKRFQLTYSVDDVRYIIVADDDDRDSICDYLELQYQNRPYLQEEKRKLMSRIITHKQIIEDF